MLVEADGYVLPNGERNQELDEIAALVVVAKDTASRLHAELDPMTVSYAPKDPGTGA